MTTGFGFPFQVTPTGTIRPSGDEDAELRGKIVQVLFTAPGERVNQPKFGCGLLNLVFDPNNTILAAAVEFTVGQALTRWLGEEIVVAGCRRRRPTTRRSPSRWPTYAAATAPARPSASSSGEAQRWLRSVRVDGTARHRLHGPRLREPVLRAMREQVPRKLPEWKDFANEADFGNVLLELFAHIGDILSYYQDRVANESFLGTAVTRRSVIEHLTADRLPDAHRRAGRHHADHHDSAPARRFRSRR